MFCGVVWSKCGETVHKAQNRAAQCTAMYLFSNNKLFRINFFEISYFVEPFRTVCIVSLQLLHIAKFSSQFNCIDCHFQVSAAKLAGWPSIKMMQFWIFQPVCCLTSSSVESVQQFQVYFFIFPEIISIKDINKNKKKLK